MEGQRLDLVSNDAGELVRREKSRELGAEVVLAVYRLLRLARMHDTANKAFVSQLEQTHALVAEYGLQADGNVNVLFAQRAVFIAGQLLKGSRQVYEAVTELGEMLDWCGGAELTILRDITAPELKAFAESVAQALRVEKAKTYRSPTPKIRLRPVNDLLRGLDVEDLTSEQRIVRTYATAVVIMRRLYEDLAGDRLVLPRRVKRIAQKLVDLSEGTTPAFLGITEMRNANHDDAGRAVNGAILAVSMARQLTEDRTLLAQIAMAAMLHDVGRPRAAAISSGGPGGMEGVQAFLTEEAEDAVAAGTAAVLTALGRLNEATITRTVIAFEAQWLRRASTLGPAYHGVRGPTIQARMIAVARRFNDLLIPEPGLPPPPSDYAIATLWTELSDPADRVVVRLLASALRLFPVGTVVGLSTGEVAAVIPGGDRDAGSAKPRVRIVMDAAGLPLDRAVDVDLGHPGVDDPPRAIVKVLSVEGWAKGLSLRPRTDGDEIDKPAPMPWQRDGAKTPSVSRIIASPVAPPGATPPPAEPARPGTKRPTATGAIAPSFHASRGEPVPRAVEASRAAPSETPTEPPPARAPLAPAFEAPPARAALAPAFEEPEEAAPPPPAASARERATPPPVSERVTPASRRVAISGPLLGAKVTPSPPLQAPGALPAEEARARATPPPVSERVTPPSRRVPIGARATPSPPLQAPAAEAPPRPGSVRPTPSARPIAPPPAGRMPPGATPTPSAPPIAPPPVAGTPSARAPTPRGTPSPGAREAPGEDAPVRWGRRLEDFPASTPLPPTRTAGPFDSRTKVAPSASSAAMQSEAVRLVPTDLVPSAHGTLGVTPLAHILVYMLDNRATGSVSFHEPDGWEHIVTVYDGAPSMVKTERPIALFGNELVSRGFIARDAMLRGVEDARRAGHLLGEHLLRAGLLSRPQLVEALQAQVVHKVSGLANLPEGTRYAFYPGRNFLEGWAGGEQYPADPLSTILDSVRGWMDRVRILGTLSRIGAQPLVLHPDADLSPLELSAEEQVVLDVIRGEGIPLAHLFDRQVADVEIVRSMVYMLAITRQFEFSRERGEPMRGGRPAAPARTSRKRVSGAMHLAVPDPRVGEHIGPPPAPGEIPPAVTPIPRSRDTDPAPPVVDEPAPEDQTDGGMGAEERAALTALADGIADELEEPAPEEAEVVDEVDVEFDAEEFDPPQAPLAGDQDPAERLLVAMNDFRLAQEALQRGDVVEAEGYAERACEGDPGNGDHLALLAWIRARDASAEAVEDSLFLLGQVLEEEPTLLRARLYRGRLHKRGDRFMDALRDFEAVLEVNPRHREAASEVKYLRMRLAGG